MAWRSISTYLCILGVCLAAAATTTAQNPSPAAPTTKLSEVFNPKMLGGGSDANLPTFITSDSLALDTETRLFTYSGNVTVKHGDVTLTCKSIQGTYSDKNQIQVITAKGDVVITRPPALKATGQKAIYDAVESTVILTENPAIEQEGSQLTADQIKVFLKDNRSEATGQVHVRMIKKPELPAKASPTPSATPTPTPTPKAKQKQKPKPSPKTPRAKPARK